MNSHRLDCDSRIDRSCIIEFTFNEQRYKGFGGDTLSSALLANGVSLVARSWKYHRARGILSAGVEEPNALVQLFEAGCTIPNARATEVSLVDGLVAQSIDARPSKSLDLRAFKTVLSRLIPAGFYYKTFMASAKVWHFVEKHIRAAGGLGVSPALPDPDRYTKRFAHADVLVIGAGISGLHAALAASSSGARVILCDEQAEPGGWLLSSDETIDGLKAADWVSAALTKLSSRPEVLILPRTTAYGYHDHNLVTLVERRGDHCERSPLSRRFREQLWKVRARQVVLATGAHERPLVFANNDLPGIMLAGAVATYVRRYAVRLGQNAVLFTNNDAGYDAALALKAAGIGVQVIDARISPSGSLSQRAMRAGIAIFPSTVITEARGREHVTSAMVQRIDEHGHLVGTPSEMDCDLLAVSGGFSPVIHLHCQSGSKAVWDEGLVCLVPGQAVQAERSAGACRGARTLWQCAIEGVQAGADAARAAGFNVLESPPAHLEPQDPGRVRALWLVPHAAGVSRAPKQFIDFQNDVTAADVHLAVREGFDSMELIKRYTGLGFGTDQGKTGNINALGIAAQILKRPLADVGTTTFRPNYTPVTFGAIAGLELGDAFEPIRTTPVHEWHARHGAKFEDVGQWKRAWYYPKNGEDLHTAVAREVRAVRRAVGMLDASTLGKIDIQGPDASTLLNWVYSNAWSKLEVGKCRYGLMLDENGMVFDDGVTVRLGEHHFLMHTTTGGAARVLAWLERWLQTEWPHLNVYLTSVTDQWATTVLAGPKSRDVLGALCTDVDFDDQAFPFMSYKEGIVAGVRARIMRISFSGERCYEVNVPAAAGLKSWEALAFAGMHHGITPYGTEAMHVLRAEKGFIIVGQDTDGSVTPIDLGMSGMVAKTKDFIGKRSLSRADTSRPFRKQLVGLLTDDPEVVIAEGSQIVDHEPPIFPAPMIGHVTSSYASPTLGRSIALALVQGGLSSIGEKVQVATREGTFIQATIAHPTFLDPTAERQNA